MSGNAGGFMTKDMILLELSPCIGINTWYFKFLLKRGIWFPTNLVSVLIGLNFFSSVLEPLKDQKGVKVIDVFFGL